jgi:hypothetical protein
MSSEVDITSMRRPAKIRDAEPAALLVQRQVGGMPADGDHFPKRRTRELNTRKKRQ